MRQRDIAHMNWFLGKNLVLLYFGGVEGVSMVNEEDLEVDEIIFEDMVCD